jgi:hypothetical protein
MMHLSVLRPRPIVIISPFSTRLLRTEQKRQKKERYTQKRKNIYDRYQMPNKREIGRTSWQRLKRDERHFEETTPRGDFPHAETYFGTFMCARVSEAMISFGAVPTCEWCESANTGEQCVVLYMRDSYVCVRFQGEGIQCSTGPRDKYT